MGALSIHSLKFFLFACFGVVLVMPHAALAQRLSLALPATQAPVCASLPCTYEAQSGEMIKITGSFSQKSDLLYIDTQLAFDRAVGTLKLYLGVSSNGNDMLVYAQLSRLGYNSYGMPTLGPVTLEGIVPGVLSNRTFPTFSTDDIVALTSLFISIDSKDVAKGLKTDGSGGGGGGGSSSTCTSSSSEGDPKCIPVADENRFEKFGCNFPIVTPGIPFPPIFPKLFVGDTSVTEAVNNCCVEHDICYINGGCSADRAACDKALAECLEAGDIGLELVVDCRRNAGHILVWRRGV